VNISPIKQIYKFNKEAGLLDKPYSDEKECAYPIEEALEGFGTRFLTDLAYRLDIGETTSPKLISRAIVTEGPDKALSDVDRLDKHLDIIVFSFGSIFKLGLSPQEAMNALGIVMTANLTKLSVGTDSEGKQMKPTDFIGPEEQLQKLLDRRSS
jgi:uncharacterized Rmd1/YagE family protein